RIRCLRRLRQPLPDATLVRLLRPTTAAERRPDKAFTPHPATNAGCDAVASYQASNCCRK
ncbi:hypothetical protein, partial [Escherichia coli]|uniref:hypothetical protein n=1 Tax=Escherichia coli TaxID=562 RepID=UPI001BE4CF31